MMAQWQACKHSAPGCLLLFRLGDFYEAFHEDATILARELELTLTKRQEIPMSGMPHHTAENAIDKLVGKGYRVAIAEQVEDPKLVKGLVKREIVRVVTPGTVITSSLLSEKRNNFLASISQLNAFYGLAVLDLTTADFRTMEFESEQTLLDELFALRPSELLAPREWKESNPSFFQEISRHLSCTISSKESYYFDHRIAADTLLRHFKIANLSGFGLKGMPAAINSAGALLSYVHEDLNLPIDHVTSIRAEKQSAYLSLNYATQRHLELIDALHEGKDKKTLLKHLDETQTPMGGRLLKQWITHPLLSPEKIQERQDAIALFLKNRPTSYQLKNHLGEVRDLERLIMRIESGYASPRDLAALRFSLEQIAPIQGKLRSLDQPLFADEIPDVSSLVALIAGAISDQPPLRLSDGGAIKTGFHAELDELRALQADRHTWIANYQVSLRESTGIRTLKVGFTNAFGYYIEVSRGQAEKMPEQFQRRQTLVNAERFITPELKEYEYKMLHAEERMSAIENEIFHAVRSQVSAEAAAIRKTAQIIAQLDCLLALAVVAERYHYTRPIVDQGDILQIEEGRHPVIEAFLPTGTFIANDVSFTAAEHLFLITGPNMAGKSTYIRQVALIVILAQMGSYVPAKKAHIGIVDKVFSRIGASDDLASGQSTFMVEMTETASILHTATSRSLVILDEIGRGTSTYDGISIAWAVAEYILRKKAKTLFATHYWELTKMEGELPGAYNLNVAVQESPEGIVFLRKILKGGTDKSYGIHVAKLAGLPHIVIKRAQEMLEKLEKNSNRDKPSKQKQLDFFAPKTPPALEAVFEEIKTLDCNALTPLDALRKITEWKTQLT
jgi:DNA mismatch repair protein MutS